MPDGRSAKQDSEETPSSAARETSFARPTAPSKLSDVSPDLRALAVRLSKLNAEPPMGHRPWVRRGRADGLGGFLLAALSAALGAFWLYLVAVWVVAIVLEAVPKIEAGDSNGYSEIFGAVLLLGLTVAVLLLPCIAVGRLSHRRLRRYLASGHSYLHLGAAGIVWRDGGRVAFVPWGNLLRAGTTGPENKKQLEVVVRWADGDRVERASWVLPDDAGVPADVLAEEIERAAREPAWRVAAAGAVGEAGAPAEGLSLEFRCESCRANLPIRPAEPEVVCAYCGARSRWPAEIQRAVQRFRDGLAAAGRNVGPLVDRVRRLEEAVARAAFHAALAGFLWGAIFAFAGVVLVVHEEAGRGGHAMGVAFLIVALPDIAAGFWLPRRVRRKVAVFRNAVAAVPAQGPGGTARCRACGADLPAPADSVERLAWERDEPSGTEGGAAPGPAPAEDIRRCAWCGVESLVLPRVYSGTEPDLAERIRAGAPRLVRAEVDAYEAVRFSATMHSLLFLGAPLLDSLAVAALYLLWS